MTPSSPLLPEMKPDNRVCTVTQCSWELGHSGMGDLRAAGWREKHESIQGDTGFFRWPYGGLGRECGSKATIT
jgi:hypothetical protein